MRYDSDSLGSIQVPCEALYGASTVRAIENFSLCGRPISDYPHFIVAMTKLKKAIAQANFHSDALSAEVLAAIRTACDEIIEGSLSENFIVALAVEDSI